jgi:hypothetical protein
MTQALFDVEFMNDVSRLAKEILGKGIKKGLPFSAPPLKDLDRASYSQLQSRPARSPVWDSFEKFGWKSEKSFKKSEQTRFVALKSIKSGIREYSRLPKAEKKVGYGFTVQNTVLQSWRMIVPWVSANVFVGRSVCPAFEILQNWIPVFDAILEMEDETPLLEIIHEALFLISFWNRISPKNIFNPNFSNYFQTGTKFLRLATLVHLGSCVPRQENLRQKFCGMALHLFNLEINSAPTLENFLIWENPQKIIHEMRKIWKSKNSDKQLDIFSKQRIFSFQTKQLLNFLLQEAIKLAGPKVDEKNFFGLMAIGSTSHGRPISIFWC